MTSDSFVARMVELKTPTQAPNSNPNPFEDHEADRANLAATGLEPDSLLSNSENSPRRFLRAHSYD